LCHFTVPPAVPRVLSNAVEDGRPIVASIESKGTLTKVVTYDAPQLSAVELLTGARRFLRATHSFHWHM